MKILDYHTSGGKNVILEYIDKLPIKERNKADEMRIDIKNPCSIN